MLFPTPLVRHPHSATAVDILHTDNIHMLCSHGDDWVVKSCMHFLYIFDSKPVFTEHGLSDISYANYFELSCRPIEDNWPIGIPCPETEPLA